MLLGSFRQTDAHCKISKGKSKPVTSGQARANVRQKVLSLLPHPLCNFAVILQTDGETGRRKDGRTDRQKDRQTDKETERQTGGQRHTNKRTDTDRWTDKLAPVLTEYECCKHVVEIAWEHKRRPVVDQHLNCEAIHPRDKLDAQ